MKKIWIWCVAVVAVIGMVVWMCRMEYGRGYGSGYSEDQRKNWNEMIEATEGSSEEYGECFISFPRSLAARIRERKEKPDAWRWRLALPDLSMDLPTEGKATLALKHLVEGTEEGDGDACLELAARSCETGVMDGFPHGYVRDGGSFSFPSPQVIYEVDKYLRLAISQKRAGADFLLSLLEKRRKGETKFHEEDMEGYQSFMTCLDGGDFALGKVYLYLNPEGNDVLDRLDSGLRRRAGDGDVASLRNAGHLSLLRQLRGRPTMGWMHTLSELSSNRLHVLMNP